MCLCAECADDDLIGIDAQSDELIADEASTCKREPDVVGFRTVAGGVAIEHDRPVEIVLGPGRAPAELRAGGVGKPRFAGAKGQLGEQTHAWVLAAVAAAAV